MDKCGYDERSVVVIDGSTSALGVLKCQRECFSGDRICCMETVFVFGSNLAGRHGKGAALHAREHHGAIYGQGVARTLTDWELFGVFSWPANCVFSFQRGVWNRTQGAQFALRIRGTHE
jgi:hypothetical protein